MTVFRGKNDPDPAAATQQAIQQSANLSQPPSAPTAQPFTADNDAALQASINELKERDIEYKRLTSEQARQEWEQATRANLVRNQSIEANRQERNQLDQASAQAVDDQHTYQLLQHAQELETAIAAASAGKPLTPWNAPVNLLRDYAQTVEALDADAKRRGLPGFSPERMEVQIPENGQQDPYTYTDNGDGTVTVNLRSGEIFKGKPDDVIRNLAKSQQSTKEWGRSFRTQLEQQQPQAQPNGNEHSAAVTLDQSGNAQAVDFSKIPDVIRWQMDQQAAYLGYKDGQEMVSDFIAMRQNQQRLSQEFAQEREEREASEMATSFQMRNPDFPNTNEAIEALTKILDTNGLEYTADNLSMAHSHAVRSGMYQPLTRDEIAISYGGNGNSHRTLAPPPAPPSGSVDNRGPVHDERTMPLDQLRRLAVNAQLSGQAPTVMSR